MVERYWRACQDVADAFLHKYYQDCVDIAWDWVGGTVGEVININDDFWSFGDIITAIQLDADEEMLFKWHSESLEHYQEKKSFMNLKTYLKAQCSTTKEN